MRQITSWTRQARRNRARYATDKAMREDKAMRVRARQSALRRLVAENKTRWQQLYYEELGKQQAVHGSKGDSAPQA